jgi:hypothetical protein
VRPPLLPHTADAEAHGGVQADLRRLVVGGAPLVVVDSPPGAGKTGLIVDAAARAAADGDRIAVVCSTIAQSADLARRLAAAHPGLPVTVATGKDARLPHPPAGDPGPAVTRGRVPPSAAGAVTVANSSVWTWHGAGPAGTGPAYDLMLVDEAYQVPWAALRMVGPLASRHVLVGDPGQIRPFTEAGDERWHGDPLGPLVPSALAARHLRPDAPLLRLPLTWRLRTDTAAAVGKACYPDLPFRAAAANGCRALVPGLHGGGLDGVLAPLRTGSLARWSLPAVPPRHADAAMCAAAAMAVTVLCDGRTAVMDEDGCGRLDPARIAVAVARNAQAAGVRRLLPGRLGQVRVATANRLQGLEYDVVIALDPCASAAPLSEFDLDPGRLSVQLSRHRVGCLWITVAGTDDRLEDHVPTSARYFGADDREHTGLAAHRAVRRAFATIEDRQ